MLVFFLDKFVQKWRLTKLTYFLIFVVSALFFAFFATWRTEYNERLKLMAAIDKMYATMPRLKGEFEFFNVGTLTKNPDHLAVAMVMSIGNVGSTATIADSWTCHLHMRTPQGTEDIVKGEFRSFPEGLELPRGLNPPLIVGREDALYIKTMQTPIVPGAKVVGAMLCIFPKANVNNFESSEENTLVVSFRDVLGEQHQVVLRYMNHPGFDYDWMNKGEWADLPGMEQPLAAPSPR